jgi:hypothetical protein
MGNNRRNFRYTRTKNGIEMDPFDDSDMRKLFIDFAYTTLGMKFIDGTKYGIDLINYHDRTFCAEGEDASWVGDRWVSWQIDIFKIGKETLNLQNWKWFYFGLGELSKKNYGKYLITHHGHEKNIYFRANKYYDQICIVDASIIKDPSKTIFVWDKIVGNRDEPEDYICIPKEYVKTYNLQPNGLWELNGKFCGVTQEEHDDRQEEYRKNRLVELGIVR